MFNLQYDGSMFVGLYNPYSVNTCIEPYPEGTSVSFPLRDSSNSLDTLLMHDMVISAPIPSHNSNSPMPHSDADALPYTIHLVDGSIHKVSPTSFPRLPQHLLQVATKFVFHPG
jgi:hypothetical protein